LAGVVVHAKREYKVLHLVEESGYSNTSGSI
jgi:hypothetical protein